MNTKRFITAVVIIVVLVGVGALLGMNRSSDEITTFEECAAKYPVMESYPEQCNTPDGKNFVRDISADFSDLIKVDAPKANAVIASPLTITGQARGMWYFEASFPVRLEDANGTVLAQVPAQAQGEWMTENFVPFKVILTFPTPLTETGTLVVHNDNPSGLPENDKEIRIPVQFTQSSGVAFNRPVTLSIGDQVIFPGAIIVSLKQIDDSRCKPGVQCIWAGELAPLLNVIRGSIDPTPLQEVRLGTTNNKTVVLDGRTFTLQSATETTATIVVN